RVVSALGEAVDADAPAIHVGERFEVVHGAADLSYLQAHEAAAGEQGLFMEQVAAPGLRALLRLALFGIVAHDHGTPDDIAAADGGASERAIDVLPQNLFRQK